MPRFTQHLTAALILSAQTVWADVTPEQVWQSWQAAAKAQGQTITATATREGDTLTVTGITVTMQSDAGKRALTLDKIQFRAKGDGTVAVLMPDSYPVHLTLPPPKATPDAQATDLNLTILMPGAEIVASGVPLSVSYLTTLPRLEVAAEGVSDNAGAKTNISLLAKLTGVSAHYLIEGAEAGQNIIEDFAAKTLSVTAKVTGDAPDAAADFSLTLADLGGKAQLTGVPASGMVDFNAALHAGMALDASITYGMGALNITGTEGRKPMTFASTLGSGGLAFALDAAKLHVDARNTALSLNVAGTDQATKADFSLASTLADFTTKLEMSGANWTTKDFKAAIKAGLKMTASMAVGATSVNFASATGKPTKVKAALASASTDFAMDASQLTYAFGGKAFSVHATAPDIPVPDLAADLGELAFALQMPVAKSATSAPFTYLTKIIDLTLPEAIWALADPKAALPHGPTSLIIDTKGRVTLTRDLTADASALEAGQTDRPGVLNALDLSQFNLKALGAEVQAQGAFTFDNSDLTTFSGVPLPTGKLDIKATGVNALLDTLVKMGLVPPDQAMQGRMMLAMFANTSTSADEMTSALEFKDKHFFANGQQLQ